MWCRRGDIVSMLTLAEVRQAGASMRHANLRRSCRCSSAISVDPTTWAGTALATQDLLDQNVMSFGSATVTTSRVEPEHLSRCSRKLDREALKAGLTLVLDEATLAISVDAIFERRSVRNRIATCRCSSQVAVARRFDRQVNELHCLGRPLEQLPLRRDRLH
jgi:hypothetical protein